MSVEKSGWPAFAFPDGFTRPYVQAEPEAEIQAHGLADDDCRKPVSTVERSLFHALILYLFDNAPRHFIACRRTPICLTSFMRTSALSITYSQDFGI